MEDRQLEVAEGILKSFNEDLIKGEGDRGGKVIGHTKSGKPIYFDPSHKEHDKFTYQDHSNAARHHFESREDRIKTEGTIASGDVDDRMKYHIDQMNDINSKLKTKYDKLTDINDHGGAALELAKQHGTEDEVQEIKEINKRSDNSGEGISESDYNRRREISKKYQHHVGFGEVKKSLTPDDLIDNINIVFLDALEKGRKAEPVGTKKTWGNRDYIKTAQGWTPKNDIKEAHAKIHGEDKKEDGKIDLSELEKEYNSKDVDELVKLKKKLYSNMDVSSSKSDEEKLLERIIAQKFSDVNEGLRQKRNSDKEINDLKLEELKLTNSALKLFSNSPKQLEVRKQLKDVKDKIKELSSKD